MVPDCAKNVVGELPIAILTMLLVLNSDYLLMFVDGSRSADLGLAQFVFFAISTY